MNDIIAIDTETGGLYPSLHALLSISVVPSWDELPLTLHILPQPDRLIDPEAAKLNGYTPLLWEQRNAVPLRQAMLLLASELQMLFSQKKDARLVAHNAGFDRPFLEEAARVCDINLPSRYAWRCSMMLMGELMDAGQLPAGSLSLARLGELCGHWPVGSRPTVHDAGQDARACLAGYQWLLQKKEAALAAN
ncbi:MAG: hypothetical protein JWO08_2349 [Verrucomicrobiaceae bacterium]|nr:hypothetical protein [Verrucomicrobiaceae bacterium]